MRLVNKAVFFYTASFDKGGFMKKQSHLVLIKGKGLPLKAIKPSPSEPILIVEIKDRDHGTQKT
jgi:hypothetical protein